MAAHHIHPHSLRPMPQRRPDLRDCSTANAAVARVAARFGKVVIPRIAADGYAGAGLTETISRPNPVYPSDALGGASYEGAIADRRAQVAELVLRRWFQVPVVQAVEVRVLSWAPSFLVKPLKIQGKSKQVAGRIPRNIHPLLRDEPALAAL